MNLSEIVREVLDSTDSNDPNLWVALVLDQLPSQAERELALRQALVPFIRSQISRGRYDYKVRDDEANPLPAPIPTAPVVASSSSSEATRTSTPITVTPPAARSKWDRLNVGAVYRRVLRQRLHGADDGLKFLAEFTADDLIAAAEQRRDLAARNLYRAEQFEKLHRALDEYGADTVADLPERLVLDVMEAS